MNFANIKEITIPEGTVTKIMDAQGRVLWQKISPLPEEYQQVEWIQADSSVGAYIDLGFAFDTSAVIKIKQYIANDNAAYIFGAAENSGVLRCCLTSPMSAGSARLYGSSGTAFNGVDADIVTGFNEITMTLRPSYISIENVTTGSTSSIATQVAYTMSSNLFLFAQNYNGAARFGNIRRIAYFKYYDQDNKLICNLIPCYRKSDGAIGMYDSVRKIFLTNVGTGNFTTNVPIFPHNYQQVEYIAGDGNCAIRSDLLYNTYSNTGLVMKAEVMWDGQANSEGSTSFCTLYSPVKAWFRISSGYYAMSQRANWLSSTVAAVANQKLKIEARNSYDYAGYLKVNDQSVLSDLRNYNTVDFDAYLFIMGYNYQGGFPSGTGWYGRCYSCSFEDLNGNCVANFVPCYRKSDGTIGMYNTITNTFCTKIGNGTLQKGPDV